MGKPACGKPVGCLKFHNEILSDVQAVVLKALAPFSQEQGFYLGGGTAVAIMLGHRKSIDFDWFTLDHIPDPVLLAGKLREAGVLFQTGSIDRGTLHGTVSGVRVSFLEYRYPLLKPTETWPEYGCVIASPDDLACMKLAAVAQRGSRKDFIDIYALTENLFTLPEMLEFYRNKYSVRDISHVLYGLSYFDDADREPMPLCLWNTDWKAVKKRISEIIANYAA